MTITESPPTAADVVAAQRRIAPYVRRTPLLRAEVDGRRLVLKLEHLQRTGAFKLRGAVNAIVSEPVRPRQVVTASGGNHGLAVATAARLLGVPATVYVPESVPQVKAQWIEKTGACLVRQGKTYAEAAEAAQRASTGDGVRYLHAYDQPAVIAGQGTVAAEIVADEPAVDAIAVAVGGGGLAAGSVLGADGRPVIGVEPQHCACLHAALAAGEPVPAAVDSIAASALGASVLGSLPFAVLGSAGVTSVLVGEDEIVAAWRRLWEEFRLVVEPAAAVPFAAWLASEIPGELPCLVLCGGNIQWRPPS